MDTNTNLAAVNDQAVTEAPLIPPAAEGSTAAPAADAPVGTQTPGTPAADTPSLPAAPPPPILILTPESAQAPTPTTLNVLLATGALTFEERIAASFHRKEQELVGYVHNFHDVVAHAFHAHLAEFGANVTAFEASVRAHVDDLLNRAHQGKDLIA